MTMDRNTFSSLCGVVGSIDNEIERINSYNESLCIEEATQILAELEDRIVSILYISKPIKENNEKKEQS